MIRLQNITLLLLITTNLFAQVQSSNGAFFVSYGDLTLQNSEWSSTRYYNSFSNDNGLFGPGWGSNLATRLWHLPDGQIVVRRGGIGRTDLYLPLKHNRSGIYRMIDSIVKDEIKKQSLQQTPKAIIRRRAELFSDNSERADAYISFLKRKNIACEDHIKKEKEHWIQEYRESETIIWEKDHYLLTLYDHKIRFNTCGLMVQWTNETDDIRLSYDDKGRLSSFHTVYDTAIVKMDSLQHILSIAHKDSTGKNLSAEFTYNNKGLLIRSIDVDSNRYEYEYDLNLNMIFTRYANGTYRRMEYDPATNRTIGFKERNGDSSRYEYGYMFFPDGRLNLDHYYTQVRHFDSSGKRRSEEYNETEYRVKENGETYRYQVIEKTDSLLKISIYPPNVGNAMYRRINNQEAWCTYDARTRPVYLKIKDSIFITQYNVQNLPRLFQAIDSVKKDTVTYNYHYNAQGQLQEVNRNRTKYIIQGSIKSGQISISQGNKKWTIGYLNNKPSFFIHHLSSKRFTTDDLKKTENAEIEKSFNEALLLISPQKIEHEWIWEKFED